MVRQIRGAHIKHSKDLISSLGKWKGGIKLCSVAAGFEDRKEAIIGKDQLETLLSIAGKLIPLTGAFDTFRKNQFSFLLYINTL